MAQLLLGSDLDELREVVRRWLHEAPSAAVRKQYEVFGEKLIELKHAMAEQPVAPSREELETALTMMIQLANQQQR